MSSAEGREPQDGAPQEDAIGPADRSMKRHDMEVIWLHWFNAIVWFLQLATGLGLLSSPRYRFVPALFVELMDSLFGSRALLLQFHIWLGVGWVVVLLVYGIFGFRRYLWAFLRNTLWLDQDDRTWLRAKLARMVGSRARPLPPQGMYNAGQKLFSWLVSWATVTLAVTGLVLSFFHGSAQLLQWAMPVHFLASVAMLAALLVHIYMAALSPPERPALGSMFTGQVLESYARQYHRKWWRERLPREAPPTDLPARPS